MARKKRLPEREASIKQLIAHYQPKTAQDALYVCYTPLLKVMSHFESVATLKVLTSEINSVMHMQEIERGKVKQNISDYSVEFENVSFSYNDETEVFNNLSFKAE